MSNTTATALPMTTVHRIDTGEAYEYTLNPEQAVIAAYEQHTCRIWRTWRYVDPAQHSGYKRTANGHSCNGYWAKA
jgi:hypothetical protein